MLHHAFPRQLKRSIWGPPVQNAVCVTASNCANSANDFAAALAAYKIANLAANVVTVVMWKEIVFPSWSQVKPRKKAEKTRLFIETVIGTSGKCETTKNMDTESLYAKTAPGKLHLKCVHFKLGFMNTTRGFLESSVVTKMRS